MKQLVEEIVLHSSSLPDSVQREVLAFIKFKEKKLKEQQEGDLEVSVLSESALPDWNNEEEDEAWKNFQ